MSQNAAHTPDVDMDLLRSIPAANDQATTLAYLRLRHEFSQTLEDAMIALAERCYIDVRRNALGILIVRRTAEGDRVVNAPVPR